MKRFFSIFWKLCISYVVLSLVVVIITRFIPIWITPLMIIRLVEGMFAGTWVGIRASWVPLDAVALSVQKAVIAAEDARFLSHHGVDWEAVREAQRRNERMERLACQGKIKNRRVYGASTITMQTVKNAFLVPSRTYLRKALEVYFAYLVEWIWGKRRILEVYLNIIEMGSGLYGIEAAAQHYFGKPAIALNQREAALIAAILPNPRRWSPARPSRYIQRKAARIQSSMSDVALP